MNMVRQFKSAKVSLVMINEAHPKGVKRAFNNALNTVNEEQVATLGAAIASLSGDQFSGAEVVNTDQLTLA